MAKKAARGETRKQELARKWKAADERSKKAFNQTRLYKDELLKLMEVGETVKISETVAVQKIDNFADRNIVFKSSAFEHLTLAVVSEEA
jgi:hypothetical protein